MVRVDLADAVFVCVDIQPRRRIVWTNGNILEVHRQEGFTLDQLNQAVAHFHDVALPNAVMVAQFARANNVPRVFAHWAKGSGGKATMLESQPRPHDRWPKGIDEVPYHAVLSTRELLRLR